MNSDVRFYVYIVTIGFALAASLFIKSRDRSVFWLQLYLLVTLGAESIAHVCAVMFRNNMPVYHIYTPVSLAIIGWYYHFANPMLRKYRVGILLTILSFTLAACNTYFLQPVDTFCSNFVLFSGCIISGMALSTFYQLYISSAEIDLGREPRFLISLLFLIYWSSTFLSYAFHEVIGDDRFHQVYMFIWVVNLFTYSGLGFIFLFISRKPIVHAR